MSQQTTVNYKTLQRLKAEEFDVFFKDIREHTPYLNHLGEVEWMREADAVDQHEFFVYTEGPMVRFMKRFRPNRTENLARLPQAEKEFRLQFRKYLEETYGNGITEKTASQIPGSWHHELSRDEIETIPVTLEILEGRGSISVLATLLPIVVIGMLLGAWFMFFHHPEEQGLLSLTSNVDGASIYLNETKIGYTDSVNQFSNIPVGVHEIAVRKNGFRVLPASHIFSMGKDSTLSFAFQLFPILEGSDGYLRISADYEDSKVFIDSEFSGLISESIHWRLAEGEHSVIVEKSGYQSSPAERMVTISPGDTATLTFAQQLASAAPPYRANARTGNNTRTGSIDINSNVSGARIFLNGTDTGKQADHILRDLPPGSYTIELRRDGYSATPVKRTVKLSAGDLRASVDFKLHKINGNVEISTSLKDAAIYIDGKLAGHGKFEGKLVKGEHEIRFADQPGYITPETRTINVVPGRPLTIETTYFPQLNARIEISKNGTVDVRNCELYTGYTIGNRGFSSSNEAGPEVVYMEDLNDYFWKLGFAYPFRNPKGNDAIKMTFMLPSDMSGSTRFVLRLEAAASREKYPLTFSSKTEIKIKLNGNILSYYYEPRFVEDLEGLEEQEWDISGQVKPGVNVLEISTTSNNNTYYFVKKIDVLN